MKYLAVKPVDAPEEEYDLFTDVGHFLGEAKVEVSPLPSLKGAYFVIRDIGLVNQDPQVILRTDWVKVLR